MALFKCKMCGGTLEINNNETVATCEYCGTQQTLPKLDDRRANLYDRANNFRRNNDFDKAMGIYEQILNEDNTDAEAYWSLVLCRYGVEYMEDPQSHRRIPTVNRAQSTSIYMDEDYKSALQYADGYQKPIYEEEADRLEAERKVEEHRTVAEKAAKKRKKAFAITAPIVCAIIAFIIVLNAVIIPNGKYNDAIALMDAGNVVEAYEALVALDGYKDSADKANSIYDKYNAEKRKSAKVGDYVLFGAYEQDNNTSNGKEDIEWVVLEVKDGKALVISEYVLDCKPYNTNFADVTWETCSLRKWLNNDFINAAFSDYEKSLIPTVTVSADMNPEYDITNPGNATQDRVFLLSINDVNRYLKFSRKCMPTRYAIANGAYATKIRFADNYWWWWSRTPGIAETHVAFVFDDGSIDYFGNIVDDAEGCIRPALWIDLNP